MNTTPKKIKVYVNENTEISLYGELNWDGKEWVVSGDGKKFITGVLQHGVYFDNKQVYLTDYNIWESLVNGRFSRIIFDVIE